MVDTSEAFFPGNVYESWPTSPQFQHARFQPVTSTDIFYLFGPNQLKM